MNNNPPNHAKKNSGFAGGLFLGTLIGGGALFFFGTKTGKKVKNQISAELHEGNLDFDHISSLVRDKAESILKESGIAAALKSQAQESISPQKSSKPQSKKKFFKKKGKQLGK